MPFFRRIQNSFARAALTVWLAGQFAAPTGWPQTSSNSFESLAARAQALLDSNPGEAASLYRQALALRPDWAEGWLYCGASWYQVRRYADAAAAFRKGLALSPGKGNAWGFLGLAEAELADPAQAVADIRKGEQIGLGDNRPFEILVRTKAAQILVRSSLFDDAMAQLAPLTQSGDNPPEAQATMGLCALAIPRSLSDLSPPQRDAVGLAGKAAWALASQRPEEAAAAYRELVERFPDQPGVHYAHGLYLQETDLAAAIAEFRQEVERDARHWPSLIAMSVLETREGDPEAAIRSLQQAMSAVPAQYQWLWHAELGHANLTAGNVEQATAELQISERLDSGNPQVHFFLAQCYRRSGKKADAERETMQFEKLKAEQDPLAVPGLRGLTLPRN